VSDEPIARHAFVEQGREWCGACGLPRDDVVHQVGDEPERLEPYTEVDAFTSGEKIRTVFEAMQDRLAGDGSGGAKLIRRGIKVASMAGLLEPLVSQLPGWDEPDEWDARLTFAVGLALALMSDGYDPDLEGARAVAVEVLGNLVANTDDL
jgi:hypothetical protein